MLTATFAAGALYLKQVETTWGGALFMALPFLLVRFALSRDEMESMLRVLRKGLPLAEGP